MEDDGLSKEDLQDLYDKMHDQMSELCEDIIQAKDWIGKKEFFECALILGGLAKRAVDLQIEYDF